MAAVIVGTMTSLSPHVQGVPKSKPLPNKQYIELKAANKARTSSQIRVCNRSTKIFITSWY